MTLQPSVADRLARAAQLLDRPDEALGELVAAWRLRRAPEIAELVDLLDGAQPKEAVAPEDWVELGRSPRPEQIGPLLAKLTQGTHAVTRARVELMKGWAPDPRVQRYLLLIAGSSDDRLFWIALYDLLVTHADPRTSAEVIERYRRAERAIDNRHWKAERPQARRTRTAYTAAVAAECTLAKQELALVEKCAAGIRSVGATAAATAREGEVTDEALVDQIVRRFDDDAPRLVYADLLSERGDARGEYITMAIAHARGEIKAKGKLDVYVKKQKAQLLGPLARLAREVDFERGFPDRIEAGGGGISWDDQRAVTAIVTDLRWATVRELALRYDNSESILSRAPLRSLRRLSNVTLADLAVLATRDDVFPLEHVDLANFEEKVVTPPILERLAVAHERFPRLRSMTLQDYSHPPETLLRLPVVQRLASITEDRRCGGTFHIERWLENIGRAKLAVPHIQITSSAMAFTLDTDEAGSHLFLDLSASLFESRDDLWNAYLAVLRAIPTGVARDVRYKLGAQSAADRTAAAKALAHLKPIELP
jgi:uncharacterized protein (TIGR02996 family)